MTTQGAERTVFVLGSLCVLDPDGQLLGPVPAGRAAVLLRRLVAAKGALVETDSLIDALWDDDVPAAAHRVVASLVSRVRKAIGGDVITGSTTTGYRFNLGLDWSSDLAQIEELTKTTTSRASLAPTLAVTAARRALTLLARGAPDLPPAFAQREWAEEQQRHLEALERRLRRAYWDAEAALGLWDEIEEQAAGVLARTPHDEVAGRALMTATWHLGDRLAALRAYEDLRAHLRRELDVEPSAETEAMHHAIADGAEPGQVPPAEEESASTGSPPGREAEFARLTELWSATVAGRTGSAVVSGPLGYGCSTLAQQLLDHAAATSALAIRVDCFEGERSSPLQPLVTAISQILLSAPPARLPALLGTWTDSAVELVPDLQQIVGKRGYLRANPEIEHRRVLNTIRHILATAAAEQPVLLFFDDLHLAGTATVEAVQWLLHSIDQVPLLVVATVPTDRLDPLLQALADRDLHIQLGPLPESAVLELANRAGVGQDAAFIWELTQGQLLFVVEVVAALTRGSRETVPSSLRSIVLHRVRRAGADTEELLQAASVVGTVFDLDTVGQLLGRSPLDLMPAVQQALAADLIASRNNLFVFSPPIVAKTLYDNLPGPIRTLRHRQLAEILADRPELRARHQERGGLPTEAALSWYEAAMLARRSFANADAVVLFTRAIEAATAAGNDDGVTLALIGRGAAHEELGHFDQAIEDHLAAESLAIARGDADQRARAFERLGWTAYYRRDVDEAVARADEATRLPRASASAWNLLGRTRHWAGDIEGAHVAYERALEESGSEDDASRASVLSCLGALLAHADRYGDAIEVLDDAVSVAHRSGSFHALLRALFFAGLARANAGDLSGALTALQTKSAILSRYDVSFYRARTNTTMAWVWRELGEPDRALELSGLALEQSREVKAGELQIEQELHALCSLADSERLAGRPDVAAEHLTVAQGLIGNWLPFRWRGDLRVKEVGVRIGLTDPEELLAAARKTSSLKYQSLGLHLLGRGEEASELARRTGSLLLLGEVGAPAEAEDALQRLAATLPRHLRHSFMAAGRLPQHLD